MTLRSRCMRAAGILVLVNVACTLGCGDGRPKRVPVSGQVLLDGQPLAAGVDGFIRVQPTDGRAATGKIDPNDGTFTLSTYGENDGCIEGTHAVAVVVNAMVRGTAVSLIPEQYREAETSGLTIVIDGPTDALRIELTGPLKPIPVGNDAKQGDDPGPL